ncbi:DUF5777 family beta-barrel protein [Chitinophagaceae bacterium MMS25-I14]
MKKHLLYSLLTLAMLFGMAPAFAQGNDTTGEDLEQLLQKDEPHKKEYTNATFKATRIINGNTIESLGAGVLDFRISHRFGELNGGAHQFFGLDNANTRIGLDYGVTNWLMVGVGRSSFDKEYDGFVKVRILRQTTDNKMPISLSYAGGATISDRDAPTLDSGQTYYFSNRVYYYNQLLIARKFNSWLSLQLMPTHIHYNLVPSSSDPNDVFAIGVGGRIKVSHRIAVTGEYYYATNPLSNTRNSVSLGIDIETGGHVFQLHFSNSTGMTERTFIGQTTGNISDGGIHFGFNISRVFTVVKPKGFEGTHNKTW